MTATRTITRDEARRMVVRAQLLDADRPGDVVEVAEQLGYIKIDPTATIAPCEHTVLWSRIGWSYEAGQLQKATEIDRLLFEFDGAFRPMSLLPLMLPAMRAWPTRESSRQWLAANDRFRRDVLARLRAEGPLLAADIPDTAQVDRAPDGWSGSNQVPHMLDFLARQGEVAVVRREGRHRRWDLAERVYPRDLPELSVEEAALLLDERRLQAAGIAKQKSPWSGVGMAGEPVAVEGSGWRFRADPAALAALADEDDGGRVALLNPYDSLLFDRPRLAEVFEFAYVLEQFKPAAQRTYGYFAHPILIGDRFAGMLTPRSTRRTACCASTPCTSSCRSRPRSTTWCAPRSSNWGSGSAFRSSDRRRSLRGCAS
ncbi:DNA glycosylase AlkZ-like family protein [Microbacterium sp. HJ5]